MDSLFYPQIDFILKRGTGIKACLFDSESKQIISNLIPLSVFTDNGFFYFEYLSNKNKVKITGMSCVAILRPSNLKELLEEILCPFYSNYIVLFTSQIDPFVLEIMANSDIHSVVSEVHEINVDIFRQAQGLYTTESLDRKRNLDALHSLLLTLEVSPAVLIQNNDNTLLSLGKNLITKIDQYNFTKKGNFVLLKRNFDLITPLIHDWHYLSMINEHIGVKNSVILLNGKSYLLNDQFFTNNKFGQIADVGEEIKKLVKNMEQNRVAPHDFDEIQDHLAQKSAAEAHLNIYNKIVENAAELQKTSEIEAQALLNKEFDLSNRIEELSYKKALKVLLIYFLKHVKNWEEYSKNFPKFRTDLMKFYERGCQKAIYRNGFNMETDIKLGYISPLKRIVKHLILNKMKENLFIRLGTVEVAGPIVIFIDGGATLCEYREISELSSEYNIEIILISTGILDTKQALVHSEINE